MLEPGLRDGVSVEVVTSEVRKQTAKLISPLLVQRIRDSSCILESQNINNSRSGMKRDTHKQELLF